MLHHGDARQVLRTMDSESVDLIVSDVPYKNISGGNKYPNAPKGNLSQNDGNAGFAHNNIEIHEYADQMYRVLRNPAHCYIMVNHRNMFEFHATMLRSGFQLHNILTWVKNTCTPNRWYMNDREFIMFFRKGAAFPINNQSAKTTLYHPVVPSPRLHPTQKPLGLMSDLITNSSQIGDVVLDPFMGVGTTCLAASILGRDYIGVEIDEQYYNIAVNLLDGE